MERAGTESIGTLLNTVLSNPSRVAKQPAKRCQNGKCHECGECLENARGERIFAEKFADPTYYSRAGVRAASPLSCL